MKHLYWLAAMLFLWTACTKETEQPPVPPVSYLMFYNGAPGLSSMIFMNTRFNGNWVGYNYTGRGPVGAWNSSQYDLTDTGYYRIGFSDTVATTGDINIITEGLFQLQQDAHYTVYLLDSLGFYSTLFTQDDTQPDHQKAKIRLVHMAPDAGPVKLRLDTAAVPGIDGVRFRGITDYVNVDPDIKPGIRIMSVDPATGEESSLVRKSFPLEAGRCYTMILRGYRQPADEDVNKTINLSTINNF